MKRKEAGMADTRKPVIQVKDLYKVYRVGDTRVRALNGVDFTIYKGEFCAIVGTSGSGTVSYTHLKGSGAPSDCPFRAGGAVFDRGRRGRDPE